MQENPLATENLQTEQKSKRWQMQRDKPKSNTKQNKYYESVYIIGSKIPGVQ